MELSDLTIFRAVVREGGVTRAAKRLHRVQSNVTTRVRQLEQRLGVALFTRDGKKLHLSPAGHLLLDYADRLLALAQEAREAVRGSRPGGLFRLGAMESTAAVRLPAALSEFHRRHPQVTLELRTGNPHQLAAAILADDIDAAFVAEPVATAQFDSMPVYSETLAIIAARHLAKVTARGNTPRTVIAFEHGCPHRSRLEAWFARRQAVPERTIEMTSYHAMLGCVLAGMGVSLLPLSVLRSFPERRRLAIYPLEPGHRQMKILLIWRKGVRSPKIDALIEVLGGAARA